MMRYSEVVELQALIHDYMKDHFVDEQWGRMARWIGLEEAFDKLPSKDRKVMEVRWGLVEGGARTLEEVGRVFGVTRERIRQIEDRSMKSLRKILSEELGKK